MADDICSRCGYPIAPSTGATITEEGKPDVRVHNGHLFCWEAAKADAARYRYLREHCVVACGWASAVGEPRKFAHQLECQVGLVQDEPLKALRFADARNPAAVDELLDGVMRREERAPDSDG